MDEQRIHTAESAIYCGIASTHFMQNTSEHIVTVVDNKLLYTLLVGRKYFETDYADTPNACVCILFKYNA